MATSLRPSACVQVAKKAFEKLGWNVVYSDENTVEAKRPDKFDIWTEKIIVSYEHGAVKAKSTSLQSSFYDVGRNSKRVRLFLHVFNETEKGLDMAALLELEKTAEKSRNWDNYEVPTSLPPPPQRKQPKLWISIVGAIATAILLGFALAFLTLKSKHVFFLFEIGVALGIGFAVNKLMRKSNYKDFGGLLYLVSGTIILTYFLNQFFQFKLLSLEVNLEPISFFDFIKIRYQEGLYLKSSNLGGIGLVVSWAFQIGLTWLVCYYRLSINVINYHLESIPPEVVNYAFYLFAKDKTEPQVRTELSKMGWTTTEDQNDVFTAMEALQSAVEHDRG